MDILQGEEMAWLFLSLTCAFAWATTDALNKRLFSHLNVYEMAVIRLLYGAPFLFLILLLSPVPPLDSTFFKTIIILLPLETVALFLHIRAIRISPLSLSMPFLAFTPLFLIFTGLLFLKEIPNQWGAMGILLIVFGSYWLNLDKRAGGVFYPFKAIFREEGSWLMLIVSFIYAFTSALGKLAIMHSSPIFFGCSFMLLHALLLMILLTIGGKVHISKLLFNPRWGFAVGISYVVVIITHMYAISLVEAAYMISIKRTSLIFGVLYGLILFKEKAIGWRLIGTSLMVAGAIAITLFG